MTDPRPGSARDQFASDWLTLREPADHAARATPLNALLRDWLEQDSEHPVSVVDLGAGLGSNLRYLAPRLPGPQSWTLVDHDPVLLEAAMHRCADVRDSGGQRIASQPLQADLRRFDTWTPLITFETRLLTASALLDLVSTEWLESLVSQVLQHHLAVLMVLSVDGDFGCSTKHPDDPLIRAAFNAHQRGEGPFGKGLGPDATAALSERLIGAGYRLQRAASPWHVSPQQADLQRGLIQGWYEAATEQQPEQAGRIADWAQQRLHEVGTPGFDLWVGHTDLLALPPATADGA